MDGPDPGRDRPPGDPEEWSDDQWIRWLKETDGEEPSGPSGSSPVTTMGRLTHSPEGQVLGQAMLGVAYAMFGRRDDEVVVVVRGADEPADDGPVTLELDEDHPERSRAILRPRSGHGRSGSGPSPR